MARKMLWTNFHLAEKGAPGERGGCNRPGGNCARLALILHMSSLGTDWQTPVGADTVSAAIRDTPLIRPRAN
jgi:hypothetical protein